VCGFDTELSRNPGAWWDDTASAGLESIPLVPGDHPYVVKSPWSHQFIRQLLDDRTVHLDHVLVPLRRLEHAAASRIVLDLQQLYRTQTDLLDLEDNWTVGGAVPGGVIYSLEPVDVARVLAHSFYRLLEALVEKGIPVHFLSFPRFCDDLEYLLQALAPILPTDLDRATLVQRIAQVIKPDKIRVGKEMADTTSETPVVYPELSRLHATSLKREVKRLTVELADLRNQLKGMADERDALANALRCATGHAESMEKRLEDARVETNILRSTFDAEKKRTDALRSLQTEQAEMRNVLSTIQYDVLARFHHFEAELASFCRRSATRGLSSRLRETGNRFTGGGLRALLKRLHTKLLRLRPSRGRTPSDQ
jgi:hypothetical protein